MKLPVALVSALLLLSACLPSPKEICRDRLPEMQRSLENAIAVLKDWHDDNAGRSLASLGERGETAPYTGLSESDRKSWQKWAEGHLVETQRYIDQVPADPRFRGARAALTEMANEYVAFHGYAGESRTGPMIRSLEKVRADGEKIQGDVCPAIR